MSRITLRQLAATLVLAASVGMTALAADAPPAAPAGSYTIPSRTPAYIKNAIQSPARSPAMVARDADRRPAEILSLSGIRPGNKVVMLGAADPYYVELMTEVVGPKGMVYFYEMDNWNEVFGEASRKFVAAHPNTSYTAGVFDKLDFPKGIDLVFSVLYFHEMLKNNVDMSLFHSKIFKNMKAGATYLVVDHNAPIGRDMRETLQADRIDPSVTRQTIGAEGFSLIEDSRVLQNLADEKRSPASTPENIDKTDKAVYVFRKPIVY